MAEEFFNWKEVDPAWAEPADRELIYPPVATNGNVPSVYQAGPPPAGYNPMSRPPEWYGQPTPVIVQQMPNNSGSLTEKVVVLGMLGVIFIGGAAVLIPLVITMVASLAVVLCIAVVALGVAVVGIKALMDGMNGHATGPRPSDTGANLPTLHRRR